MVDELKVTNEIWRRWDEQKITPPMTWQQLWEKVREYIKAGKDPYDILRGPAPSKEWMEQKGFVETKLPWPNLEPEAIVEEREIPMFAPALLDLVKKAWHTKESQRFWEWIIEPVEGGVLVGLRGALRPHELFSQSIMEKFAEYQYEGGTTLYFESEAERNRAKEFLLRRYNISLIEGPGMSLSGIANTDYILELLATEGFDTSKILVER